MAKTIKKPPKSKATSVKLRKTKTAVGYIPETLVHKCTNVMGKLQRFDNIDLKDKFTRTVSLYNHLVKHRGVVQGTKRFKDYRVYTLKWILGLKPEPIPCASLHKDGWLKDLWFLRELGNPETIDIVYTILNVSRLSSNASRIVDYSTITKQPPRGPDYLKVIQEFSDWLKTNKFVLKHKKSPSSLARNLSFYSTTKSGPNSNKLKGLNGQMTAGEDAKAVLADRMLHETLLQIVGLYRPDLTQDFDNILTNASKTAVLENPIHSRIAVLSNPENKQRVVAIVDYWSQMLLMPLEEDLFSITRLMTNTYAFDQEKGRQVVSSFTVEGSPVSYDASSFTDRFPMELQCEVLTNLYGEDYSKLIRRVLCSRKFLRADGKGYVRYGAGQPMGAHASWALANLTHTLFAEWCLSSNGENIFGSVAVLGDDIAFKKESDASRSYLSKMKTLGVSFSEFKGFTSNETTKVAEFAKGLYLDGKDVSGISPRPLLNFSRDFKYIIPLMDYIKPSEDDLNRLVDNVGPKYRGKTWELISMYNLIKDKEINFDKLEGTLKANLQAITRHEYTLAKRSLVTNTIAMVISKQIDGISLIGKQTTSLLFKEKKPEVFAELAQSCCQLSMKFSPSNAKSKPMEVAAYVAHSVRNADVLSPVGSILAKMLNDKVLHPVIFLLAEMTTLKDSMKAIQVRSTSTSGFTMAALLREDWSEAVRDLLKYGGRLEPTAVKRSIDIFETLLPDVKANKMFAISNVLLEGLNTLELEDLGETVKLSYKNKFGAFNFTVEKLYPLSSADNVPVSKEPEDLSAET